MIDSLTEDDFAKYPIWRFTNSDSPDETCVTPVRRFPVSKLQNCIVGCPIRLADETVLTGILGNLDLADAKLTEHFLTLSVFHPNGKLFHMARYHDFDAAKRGPAALAKFLGIKLKSVFPITYDISKLAIGSAKSLCGTLTAKPRKRLTRYQIIALAVPKLR